MASGKYNFTIEQGTTFQRTFKYKDASGNPLDLSDHSVRMQIRIDSLHLSFALKCSKDLCNCVTEIP